MRRRSTATTIAGTYLVVALTWIAFSTPLAAALDPWLPLSPAMAELIKGIGFVGVTAVLLWVGLRRSEQRTWRVADRFRSLAEELPVPIYLLDPASPGLLYANPAFHDLMDRFAAAEPAGLEQLVNRTEPTDARRFDLGARIRGETTSPFRLRVRTDTGAWHYLQVHEQRVLAEDGGPLLQGLILDVTEQGRREQALEDRLDEERAATRELERLREMQAAFLQAVSHELRTPLTVITGAAELLEQRHDELDVSTEDVLRGRLTFNASKLSRLLADLLDVDRLTRGVIEAHRRWVDLRVLVDRTVGEMELGGRRLAVHGDVAWAHVDAAQIERVVENLVINAVRHTPPTTTITVTVHADDDQAELTVTDDGPGLPEGRDLFAAFERGEPWSPSPGAGIGLTLVDRFIQLHGGSVEVQPGAGARFVIRLPHHDGTSHDAVNRDLSPRVRVP